ncbi:MAG: Gfo/Idh/MocA family protein, partial [Burkholderiales bacterium]
MKKNAKRIGLGIIGAGRVGLIRGDVATRHTAVDWIGIAEKNPERGKLVAEKIGADFLTTDYRELLRRPELTAAVVSTDEHLHVDPILGACERGIPLMIEKPLATTLEESEMVLKALTAAGIDAVIGYTQRFRRRWLVAKEKITTGALGEVTMVTSRGFMNRLVAIDNYKRTNNPAEISPMVISGTHALDLALWLLEGGRKPVEVYARSVDKALGPTLKGIDGTAYTIIFDDDTVYSGVLTWG